MKNTNNNFTLLIGTTNKGKFREISEVLSTLPIKLISLQDLAAAATTNSTANATPHESGSTYAENARIKSAFYYAMSNGIPTLAEDSGIEIDALPGELGIHTRRWGNTTDNVADAMTDEEWLFCLLNKLKEFPPEKRTGRFHCTACLTINGKHTFFTGTCEGTINIEPQTAIPHGIPLSSCFQPIGFNKVYAALDPDEKNRISHRGSAMHAVKKHISQIIHQDDEKCQK